MPKRKIQDSLLPSDVEAQVLDQLRAIYRKGAKQISDSVREAMRAEHARAVADGRINPDEYVYVDRGSWPSREIIMRRRKVSGRWKWIYRVRGRAGIDLPVDPAYFEILKRERDFQTMRAKARRVIALHQRNKRALPRPTVANRHDKIKGALEATADVPGRIKRVANEFGVSVRTVQRVQNEMRQDRK